MKQQLFISLVFGLLVITACQPKQDSNSSTSASSTRSITPSGSLTMYAHRYLIQDDQLFKQYETRAQKKVALYLTSGIKSIELAKQNKLNGDIVILEDLYQAHQLKKLGVLEPYNAGTFGEFIPSKYIDNEGYWGGLTKWTMSFVYRSNKAEELEMQRYTGAINPKYAGRVALAHPDSSGLVAFVAAMMATHGEEPAKIYLQLLNKNLTKRPQGSDWDALQSVLNNEADIAFMNGSEYLRFKNSGNHELYQKTQALTIDIPVDAAGNNYYNITPACILKNSPNRNYAVPMIEFLTTTENQNIYAESMTEYPLNIYSVTTNFLNDIYNVAQGPLLMEDTENYLDAARELIRSVMGV